MEQYALGIDFGTLSARAVLINAQTGSLVASAVAEYAHGSMETALPCGRRLGPGWALQHPLDYLDALEAIVPAAIARAGIDPRNIIGIGVDCTGTTPLPVLGDGTPLCFLPEYAEQPHAYAKLWKHHAAHAYALRMTDTAIARHESWLPRYGGKISSEWLFPKLWQLLNEAPDIYARMAHFMDAGDWIVWMLTGVPSRNACLTGYKALWSAKDGYPSREYLAALDPRLQNAVADKLSIPVIAQGACVGVTGAYAARLGLPGGIPVAAANADAHVNVAGAGISQPGKMLVIMGTSCCHMLLGRQEKYVPGICGCVEGGILPGMYGYEAGQSAVGDLFGWFVKNCVPERCLGDARAAGLDIHAYLQLLADRLLPGRSGLIALDWLNGNRSVLADADLTGLLLGLTLASRPEEVYRALIEAAAFGTRKIVENFISYGLPVSALYFTGGIPRKSPFIMQLYADVIGMPVSVTGSAQGSAFSSALFGLVAAGSASGGYDTVAEAATALVPGDSAVYTPCAAQSALYNNLYAEYMALHDYFGRGSGVMKRLAAIRRETLARRAPR
jgi:L-ribulokinase